MLLPQKPKTAEQLKAEKERAELNARWERVEPSYKKVAPKYDDGDASTWDKKTLRQRWSHTRPTRYVALDHQETPFKPESQAPPSRKYKKPSD